jgi:hypothetical protein
MNQFNPVIFVWRSQPMTYILQFWVLTFPEILDYIVDNYFLTSLDLCYKNKLLRQLESQSDLLVYCLLANSNTCL